MEHATEIRFSLAFGYWDRVRATLALIGERPLSLCMALLWPLCGVGLAAFALAKGRPITGELALAIVLVFAFVPAMVLLGTAMTHYFHRQSREPFAYTFDGEGIHVAAVTYDFTHKWPAIFKVKRRRWFLMFFFSPGCAHCIPFRAIPDSAVQAALVAMAAAHGADVRSA
ncbi:YcxB family protein [Lysobacter enzymogenes]|uniref:YcxB family protein n=1 Tax=Lysobacter enzymogenes TaxID=69 RepID=UPI0037486ED9